MTLVYGSVCSGIEAVTCAWHELGARAAWFAEIEPFPSAVLSTRWPGVLNLGDFTKIGLDDEASTEPVDILVGGTPCQSFSDAGGRAGMDDPRGVLALEFLRLAGRIRPRWVVWENVRGVLSADDGEAFASIVGLLVQLGYGVAWRMLDAQFFGVPQRRRRVFVVGFLGDWRPPSAVLFESPSMRRDPRTRGQAGTSVAVPLGIDAERGGDVASTIGTKLRRTSAENTLALDVTFALAFHATQDPISSVEVTPLISAESSGSAAVLAGPELRPRRLTPLEVERCFGFPDGYTAIPGASDTARYAALGNSMAVPVMRWIGRRLLFVDRVARGAA